MKALLSGVNLTTLALVCLLGGSGPAAAQVAGASTTTVEASVTESTQIALGWSVRKTLLGKTLFNDGGQKIGKVVDLIISPERNVSFVIVGTGGLVGIGRHDVAIPVTRIHDQGGRLVMPGATKDMIKGLPEFTYAVDTSQREAFIAAADQDIAKGKARVADLEKQVGVAAADAKSRIDLQVAALGVDVKAAEARLAELKQASASRWKSFEAGVSAATARLRKSIDTAAG